MRALIPLMLAGCCIAFPVMAQDTRPAKDLAKENRDLKGYAVTLEQQVIQLRLQLQEADRELRALRAQGQTPQLPYRMPKLLPPDRKFELPMPYRMTPTTPQPGHDGWRSFRFNGGDVYLIPVKEGATAMRSKPPTTQPAPNRIP